ncbi:MAG: RNA methyltransferase [Alphaproteobacteria bacterium PRO2]|nr:RNA methyltransferase [Alphaproteobacteria bacterium PRO2]
MKDAPAIILVRPQMGENIGAAARAMLNFGLTDLRIVAPRDGWPNRAAIDMSAGALEIIPEVKVFETLADAVKDLHFLFATTARPRDMVKPVYTPAAAIEKILANSPSLREGAGRGFTEPDHNASTLNPHPTLPLRGRDFRAGFVFGPERSGLENDDVARCHAILTMKTNPDFSSINIAASVMVICYEWLARQSDNIVSTPTNASFPAAHEKLEELLVRLEADLDKSGFFRAPDQKPTMVRNIRNLFTRTGMTDQEVRTFHGMLSSLTGKNKI